MDFHNKTIERFQIKNETIIKRLATEYRDAKCALHHETPYQLLIATILSAQCTDERVNLVTPVLFKKYPDAASLAAAPTESIEAIIRSTGFYKSKAKNIKSCAEMIIENFNNELPRNIEDLVLLPGVGRKTANVLLGNAFEITSGIVVDTHVLRLSNRLGWIKTDSAEKAEFSLQKIVPKKYWIDFSHWLIHHGRQICKARSPKCGDCFLQDLCPHTGPKLGTTKKKASQVR
jgi:endonuclease-3